jgi:hypothetical protein
VSKRESAGVSPLNHASNFLTQDPGSTAEEDYAAVLEPLSPKVERRSRYPAVSAWMTGWQGIQFLLHGYLPGVSPP